MNKIQKELLARMEIKSVKTMMGRDGYAINCNVFLDKKKIATYRNDGNGGGGSIDAIKLTDNVKIKELETLISKLPKVKSDLGAKTLFLTIDIDWVIDEMITIKDVEKHLKKSFVIGVAKTTDVFGKIIPKGNFSVVAYKKIRDLSKLPKDFYIKEVARISKSLKKDETLFNTLKK